MKILKSASLQNYKLNSLTKFVYEEMEHGDENVSSEYPENSYENFIIIYDLISKKEQSRYKEFFDKHLSDKQAFEELSSDEKSHLLSLLKKSQLGESLTKKDFAKLVVIQSDSDQPKYNKKWLKNVMKLKPEDKVAKYEDLKNPSYEKIMNLSKILIESTDIVAEDFQDKVTEGLVMYGETIDKFIGSLYDEEANPENIYEELLPEERELIMNKLLELTDEERTPAQKASFLTKFRVKKEILATGLGLAVGFGGGYIANEYLGSGGDATSVIDVLEKLPDPVEIPDEVLEGGDDTWEDFVNKHPDNTVYYQESNNFKLFVDKDFNPIDNGKFIPK